MKASTRQWLDLARADLKSCENNLHDSTVLGIIAFHSQQAVEKAFKALLEENGVAVPKIHNLTRLYSLSEPFLNESINLVDLDVLDDVYVSTRYPVDIGITSMGIPTLDESKELYEISMNLFLQLQRIISNSK